MRSLRIVSWNIDGLAPALGKAAPKRRDVLGRLRPHLSEMHAQLGSPDVLCLQEIQLRPQDESEIDAMVSALPGYECHFSLCSDPMNAKFRGGRTYGVATYVREALRAVPVDGPAWDREGRVVSIRLTEAGLLVTNVYAVNGTSKPYYDTSARRSAEIGTSSSDASRPSSSGSCSELASEICWC